MEGKEVVRSPGIPAGLLVGLLCAALPSGAHPAFVSQDDHFLIVERPDQLLVLNGYQQHLTSRDRLVFQPFVPMRILKDRDVLGDGFTPCMRVEIDGALYFLVRDANGRLDGGQRAGAVEIVAGSPFQGDTVHALAREGLLLTSPGGRRTAPIAPGERMIRMFTSSGRTYVKCPGRSPAYGWVTFSLAAEGKQWGRSRGAFPPVSTIPARVRDSVQAELARTNEVLSRLFRFFNEQSGENRPTPHWELAVSGGSILCTLADASPERDFPQGTRTLIQSLQNDLLGTEFRVLQSSDGIEIRPK